MGSTSVAGGSGYRRYYRIEPPKEEVNMIYAFYLNENCYGYVDSWDKCKLLTSGAQGAKYKKFKNKAEAGLYLKELIKNN